MGEDGVQERGYMHFKREINYYDYTNCYIEMFNFYVPSQYFMINSLHDREKIVPTSSVPLNQ